MNATPGNDRNTVPFDDRPIETLVAAAGEAKVSLNLKYRPVVFQTEEMAFNYAGRSKAGTVMLGDGAYWVVCLADAARLEKAGYEFAPRR